MKYIVAILLASTAIASAQTQTDFKANTPISSSGVNSAFGSKLDVSKLGQANGPAKLNGNLAVTGLFDAMRSTPTGIQTPASGQPGDNQALPSVNCTPVAQTGGVAGICFNMDAPATLPVLPPGNNSRPNSGTSATTVSIGLENYNTAIGGTAVGLYTGVEAQPGSGGPTWALNSVTNIHSGAQHGGAGYEMDINNVSCDPGITGTPTCGATYGLWLTGLTGFSNSVGLLVTKGGGPGTNPLWHIGVDVTSAEVSAYQDTSSATSSYQDSGTHSVGIHLGGTYGGAAITMSATNAQNGLIHWDSIPSQAGGAATTFALNPADSSIANGQKGMTLAFGGHDGLQMDQSGDVMTQGYLNPQGNLGSLSTGLPTNGLTLGWNLTNGSQESDILISGGTGDPALSIYAVNASGALTTAKGSPITDLSGTGVWTAVGFKTNTKSVANLNSTLPCSAATKGQRAAASDATAPTFLGVLVGGGAIATPAFCNGTAWVAG